MPNFICWGEEKQQFGAFVQQTPRVFQRQQDGSFQIRAADPVTKFLNEKSLLTLADSATKSQEFYKRLVEVFPAQQALYYNGRDMTAPAGKAQEERALSPEIALRHS